MGRFVTNCQTAKRRLKHNLRGTVIATVADHGVRSSRVRPPAGEIFFPSATYLFERRRLPVSSWTTFHPPARILGTPLLRASTR